MNMKQEDDESILGYAKNKFKQVKDIAQKTLGNNLLNKFINKGESYKNEPDEAKQDDIQKKGFSKFSTSSYMRNVHYWKIHC